MPVSVSLPPASDRTLPVVSIDRLVSDHYAAVNRLTLSILGDAEDADDATQECFIAAARSLENYRYEASPRTWLFSIAINSCRGMLRKRKVRQTINQTWQAAQTLFSKEIGPEDETIHHEKEFLLWDAVQELDDKHRLPVLLHYVHGLSAPEIAEILGISEGTVHSRLHYARHRLWQQLHTSNLFQMDRQEASQ